MKTKQYDVISIGEPVIDFVPQSSAAGLVYRGFAGGGVLNVLAQVCALGGNSLLLGAVGHDVFGEFLLEEIGKIGIDTSGVHITDVKHTGLSFIRYKGDGEREFWAYRNHEANIGLFNKVGEEKIKLCRILHFTSISLVGKLQREDTWSAAIYAKKHNCIVSFDVNFRKDMWKDHDEARDIFMNFISISDVVKLSEEEREFLCPDQSNEYCSTYLDPEKKKLICISLGSKGSFFSYQNGRGYCSSPEVDAVDTTGCGDAYIGAVLRQFAEYLEKEVLDEISLDQMNEIMKIANAAGAICATKYGALTAMPSLSEIKDFLCSGG